MYIVVRTDLPPAQQAVQACHAAYDAGVAHQGHGTNLVLLTVPNEKALDEFARAHGPDCVRFHEPDLGGQLTAIACHAVGEARGIFSTLSLFGQPAKPKVDEPATQVNGEPVKGRWGWYPTDWATYRKLKRLNYLLWEAVRRQAAHGRWSRKFPHNRFYRRRDGTQDPMREPAVYSDPDARRTANRILEEYRKARYPVAEANEVKPLRITMEEIEAMLAKAEAWYTLPKWV